MHILRFTYCLSYSNCLLLFHTSTAEMKSRPGVKFLHVMSPLLQLIALYLVEILQLKSLLLPNSYLKFVFSRVKPVIAQTNTDIVYMETR